MFLYEKRGKGGEGGYIREAEAKCCMYDISIQIWVGWAGFKYMYINMD